jgi:NNP family nitrate/nitrite transporter-like MFS transporter
MLCTCFFVPGFAVLSKMGSASTKNVVVSLTVPIGFLVGGGAIPAGIGLIGEAGSFSTGLLLFGGFLLVGSLSAQALKLAESSPN